MAPIVRINVCVFAAFACCYVAIPSLLHSYICRCGRPSCSVPPICFPRAVSLAARASVSIAIIACLGPCPQSVPSGCGSARGAPCSPRAGPAGLCRASARAPVVVGYVAVVALLSGARSVDSTAAVVGAFRAVYIGVGLADEVGFHCAGGRSTISTDIVGIVSRFRSGVNGAVENAVSSTLIYAINILFVRSVVTRI